MTRTQCSVTVVLTMSRKRKQKGQALIEYGFLMVLLATITFAVIALAGGQIMGLYQDVSYELTHLTDPTTIAPDGSTLQQGNTPGSNACPVGTAPELRGHKWKCK
jgi:hypothetical protein